MQAQGQQEEEEEEEEVGLFLSSLGDEPSQASAVAQPSSSVAHEVLQADAQPTSPGHQGAAVIEVVEERWPSEATSRIDAADLKDILLRRIDDIASQVVQRNRQLQPSHHKSRAQSRSPERSSALSDDSHSASPSLSQSRSRSPSRSRSHSPSRSRSQSAASASSSAASSIVLADDDVAPPPHLLKTEREASPSSSDESSLPTSTPRYNLQPSLLRASAAEVSNKLSSVFDALYSIRQRQEVLSEADVVSVIERIHGQNHPIVNRIKERMGMQVGRVADVAMEKRELDRELLLPKSKRRRKQHRDEERSKD
ncbi:unnamed protein product [Sympodiomycopsis kandeliae]